jgi:hypothetical protein
MLHMIGLELSFICIVILPIRLIQVGTKALSHFGLVLLYLPDAYFIPELFAFL